MQSQITKLISSVYTWIKSRLRWLANLCIAGEVIFFRCRLPRGNIELIPQLLEVAERQKVLVEEWGLEIKDVTIGQCIVDLLPFAGDEGYGKYPI